MILRFSHWNLFVQASKTSVLNNFLGTPEFVSKLLNLKYPFDIGNKPSSLCKWCDISVCGLSSRDSLSPSPYHTSHGHSLDIYKI